MKTAARYALAATLVLSVAAAAAARAALDGIARVVPNLHLFVPERAVLLNDDPNHPLVRYVALATGYAVLWAAGLLAASSLLFRRRDLV